MAKQNAIMTLWLLLIFGQAAEEVRAASDVSGQKCGEGIEDETSLFQVRTVTSRSADGPDPAQVEDMIKEADGNVRNTMDDAPASNAAEQMNNRALDKLSEDMPSFVDEKTQRGFENFDEFYKAATQAQDSLIEMLNKVAEETGMTLVVCPPEVCPPNGVKSLQGTIDKYQAAYNGDWHKLTDVCRASLVTAEDCDFEQLANAAEALKPKMTALKNRWAKPPRAANGYADLLTVMKVDIGHGKSVLCEIQFHLNAMLNAKETKERDVHGLPLAGHHFYEKFRSWDRDPDKAEAKEGRKAWGRSLARVVQKYVYSSVWEKCFGTDVQWRDDR